MIVEIEDEIRHRSYFATYTTRMGCSACDRAEASYQIAQIDRLIDSLNNTLKLYESCY